MKKMNPYGLIILFEETKRTMPLDWRILYPTLSKAEKIAKELFDFVYPDSAKEIIIYNFHTKKPIQRIMKGE